MAEVKYLDLAFEHKKSRTLPMRVREGPAKNLRLKRRKNAQQDTKTLWSLAGFSISRKNLIKLGRFSRTFAEITDVMSTESDF